MVVVMQEGAKEGQIQHVIDRLVSMGFDIHRSTGASQTVLGAVGVPADFDPRDVEVLEVVVAAGPCSVETPEQIGMIADRVAKAGAKILRGGAFKPRSSPYSFQGHGEKALKMMRAAADQSGLLVCSEVMDASQIQMMLPYVDILQVGARNMQNYHLLRCLGTVEKPILLKRGMSATIEEVLLSAEYIMSGGNYNVILCERGIRTFETY